MLHRPYRSHAWRLGPRFGAALGSLLLSCSRPPPPSPFTAAETNRALAPARALRARCYESSSLARAGRGIALDFELQIAPSGQVQAIPTRSQPQDPELIECTRHELNALRFPARGRDRLQLHFEIRPSPPKPALEP